MKAKTAKQTVSVPYAWIVNSTDQGRKSIKKGNLVYLQDNTEFKIELFNPLKENVLADIKINSQSISRNGLIIKPGQRFYLDCFLDDKKKFVYKTYNVDNTSESKEAIQNNGLVEVFFYKEDVLVFNNWNKNLSTINPWSLYNNYNWFTNPGTITINPCNIYNSGTGKGISDNLYTSNTTNSITNNVSTFTSNNAKLSNSNTSYVKFNKVENLNDSSSYKDIYCSSLEQIETGRIEKGKKSDQKFEEVDMNFQNWTISSVKYQLLPESQKPIEVESLKPKLVDFYDVLKKLSELHSCGILTDEEFFNKKKEILDKI